VGIKEAIFAYTLLHLGDVLGWPRHWLVVAVDEGGADAEETVEALMVAIASGTGGSPPAY
jgi:hypothetical protein